MKTALLFLVLSLQLSAQTFSGLKFTATSHSGTMVWFFLTGSYSQVRFRYVKVSAGSCLSGTGGTVIQTGTLTDDVRPPSGGIYYHKIIGGLDANAQYQVCPEALNGSTWSTGFGGNVTTLPLPLVHPAKPTLPITFDTSYPADAGSYASVDVTSNCSNWDALVAAAVDSQDTQGTIINVPANAICEGQFKFARQPKDVKEFPASAVNTSTGTITLASHGFAEGGGIIFEARYGCMPGSDNSNDCNGGPGYYQVDPSVTGPLIRGHIYYACNVTANSFKVCDKPLAQGGTVFSLPGQGGGTELVVPWPRNLKWIIVRTKTPDNQFVPEKVRVSPQWSSKMPKFRPPLAFLGNRSGILIHMTLPVNDSDEGNVRMNANIRFVGLEFTVPPNPSANVSTEPPPMTGWARVFPQNQNIIYDRCIFSTPGTPWRVYNAIGLDGANVAVIDSWFSGLTYWRPYSTGFTPGTIN